MKITVVGLGNDLLSDDGIGIKIARHLKEIIPYHPSIHIQESALGGLRIIDLLSGYDYTILIDSIKTGSKPVGYLHHFDESDFINSSRMVSFHDVNFATAVEFARQLDISIPKKFSIYAVEVRETGIISETISNEVLAVIPVCVEKIRKELAFICDDDLLMRLEESHSKNCFGISTNSV